MADQAGTAAARNFGGRIERTISASEPWWPRRPSAPAGAPNVVVMLCDDLGFSDIGCFGSEIPTPNLDAIAAEGLRYSNFHVAPMCSPTRAALLTGVNPHAAGVGSVILGDYGFPGYAMELADDVSTIAEVLRDGGYATFMVGKWHLCKEADMTPSGSKASWPLQRGFERFYGFLEAFTDFHHPHRLMADNHAVHVDQYPDSYYLTDDLTDRAIEFVRESKASDPTKPFFLYFAHGAVHAPLHAKPDDIQRHRGAYERGWDAVRAARFARQKVLGLFGADVELPPRNTEAGNDVVPWDDLTADEQRLFARYMEVYAAMVDNIDQNVGRLRAALEESGDWENTVFVFMSDNGASREGGERGTTNLLRSFRPNLGSADEILAEDFAVFDGIGGPRTFPHYPRGWAMASGTPFRLYKGTAHAGGHASPLLLGGGALRGARVSAPGGIRDQYVHVTDILPTLCELTGVNRRSHREGEPVQALAGESFVPTIGDVSIESSHHEQYCEINSHRSYYRRGWEVATLHRDGIAFAEDRWELFDLTADPAQVHDLASELPELLRDLVVQWERDAAANQVFPLDDRSGVKYLTRPEWSRVYDAPVTIFPRTPTLERFRSHRLVTDRDVTITVALDQQPKDQGVLVAHGSLAAGYVLYIENGELVFVHNGYGLITEVRGGPIKPGSHLISVMISRGDQSTWDVTLGIDDSTAAKASGLRSFGVMAPLNGIDVGIDRRSPVSADVWKRHGPFPYTGALRSVTYKPSPIDYEAVAERIRHLRDNALAFD